MKNKKFEINNSFTAPMCMVIVFVLTSAILLGTNTKEHVQKEQTQEQRDGTIVIFKDTSVHRDTLQQSQNKQIYIPTLMQSQKQR